MEKRRLGKQGLEVSVLGLGCMGMSEAYAGADEADSIATVHRAIELGVTFLDSADMYGTATRAHLEENVAATSITLSKDFARIEAVAPKGVAAGERYAPAGMASVNR